MQDFLAAANIQLLAAAPSELAFALAAFDRYGRHRYPNAADRNKALNLADCFHLRLRKIPQHSDPNDGRGCSRSLASCQEAS